MKKPFNLLPCLSFTGIFFFFLTSSIAAQQIFKEGQITFRDGQTKAVKILEDSYQNYQKGITYKVGEQTDLIQGTQRELVSFQIGEKEKFVAFSITDKDFRTEVSQERTIFLKQLEEGRLNLFVYDNGLKIKWLFIQKDGGDLQKLYVIRNDYALADANTVPDVLSIATAFHQQTMDGCFFTE